jgi:histidyl-tRNA synthetase
MSYADKLGLPFVAFLGEDEIAQGKLSLKNMTSGEQQLLALPEAADLVLAAMAAGKNSKLIRN